MEKSLATALIDIYARAMSLWSKSQPGVSDTCRYQYWHEMFMQWNYCMGIAYGESKT